MNRRNFLALPAALLAPPVASTLKTYSFVVDISGVTRAFKAIAAGARTLSADDMLATVLSRMGAKVTVDGNRIAIDAPPWPAAPPSSP